MKEHPILFSTPMVNAVVEGRKTQTRRGITPSRSGPCSIKKSLLDWSRIWTNGSFGIKVAELADPDLLWRVPPPWEVGDVLWVKETWRYFGYDDTNNILFKAGGNANDDVVNNPSHKQKWKPAMFMPKNAARIWLRVASRRAERLHVISEADALAEGVEIVGRDDANGHEPLMYVNYIHPNAYCGTAVTSFESLWRSINGKAPEPGKLDMRWQANPWVWVLEFEVLSTTGKPSDL